MKLYLKPISIYSGDIIARKIDEVQGGGQLNVRVYDTLKTALPDKKTGIPHDYDSLILTPKSTFDWETEGGPYPWEITDPTEVLINDLRIDRKPSAKNERYSPLITCRE